MDRFFYALIPAFALVVGASANAQDPQFCGSLTKIANEAQSKFRSFRGEFDGMDYASKVSLPGAKCLVDTDGEFICNWHLGVDRSANDDADELADGIKGCFPRARHTNNKSVPRIAAHRFQVNGVIFRVGYDENRNRVRLGIERDD